MPRKKGMAGEKVAALTLRVSQKTRYGVELMSRLYHEPMARVIEDTLRLGFASEHNGLIVTPPGGEWPLNLLEELWSDSEAGRFVRMATVYPSLMNREERDLLKELKANKRFREAFDFSNGPKGERARMTLESEWESLTQPTADAA